MNENEDESTDLNEDNADIPTVKPNAIMFTHFGLFWSEADVHWSGKPKSEKMLGTITDKEKRRGAPTVEERGKAKSYDSFVGIYCLYSERKLIYVGEAGLKTQSNIFKRLKQHRDDHLADSWDQFSWFGSEPKHLDSEKGDIKACFAQLEAVLIAVTNPGSNKQSGAFKNAKQVYQISHTEADGDVDVKLERITKKMDDLESLMNALSKQLSGGN